MTMSNQPQGEEVMANAQSHSVIIEESQEEAVSLEVWETMVDRLVVSQRPRLLNDQKRRFGSIEYRTV
jgi:hypothetical protein